MSKLSEYPLAAQLHAPKTLASLKVEADDSKYDDIKREPYGKLTYKEPAPRGEKGQRMAWFDCECSGKKLAIVANVKAGLVKSCGCLRPGNSKTKTIAPKHRPQSLKTQQPPAQV